MSPFTILQGDCLSEMSLWLEDNSVDAIVTDPPYGLSFMGKHWDYDVPGADVWAECLRVLKPGGHLLAFAGTRTQHRMAVRIEDAGFEIRDLVMWHYGQGFPKSKNLGGGFGSALKPATEPITMARKPCVGTLESNFAQWGTGGLNIDGCRVETGDNPNGGAYSGGAKDLSKATSYATGVNAGTFVQPEGRWPANLIHDGSDEVVAAFPQAPGQQGDLKGHSKDRQSPNGVFGKFAPANDHVARIETDKSAARFFYCAKASRKDRNEGLNGHETVILEWSLTLESPKWDNADQQVTLQVDTGQSPPKVIAVSGASSKNAIEWSMLLFGNAHMAPSLKASTCIIGTATNSTMGLTTLSYFQNLLTSESTQVVNLETASGGNLAQTAGRGTLLLHTTNEQMGSALGVAPAASPMLLKISASERRSDHPTVKPTDLMAYLCRLVTPPGGVILDPFMGSGSTGKAAMREGFRFIGIERESEYATIARARILAELSKRMGVAA